MMEAIDRREKEKTKIEILAMVRQADVIANRVSQLFSKKQIERLEAWDIFPGLFEEEKKLVEEKQEQSNLELHKAQMTAFAERWNKQRRGQNG